MTVTAALWLVVLSMGFGFLLTWLGRGVATRLGLVDFPDRLRKVQARPIPVAGGMAVLAAAILALVVTAFVVPDVYAGLADPQRAIALLAASLLIVAVG